MIRWSALAAICGATFSLGLMAAEPELLKLSGDIAVHDPVIVRDGDTYYLTGSGGRPAPGIAAIRTSKDLRN